MNQDKFENAVLYLLKRSIPTRPGLTVLLKMLYFSDYEHYRRFLSPITGAKYVALERGPVVDQYEGLFEGMRTKGKLTVLGNTDPGSKIEYRPASEVDLELFSDSELEAMNEVVARHGSETGNALSEKTHLEGPWSLVWNSRDPGRHIPYPLFRWLDNLPDASAIEAARTELATRPEVLARIAELQS